jgi:hypothetical protein
MGDPVRLLSGESDADELERALLRSLHDQAPGEREKDAMWQGIATYAAGALLASASPAGATAIANATSSASSAISASSSGAVAGSVSSAAAAGSGALLPKIALVKAAIALLLAGSAIGAATLWSGGPDAVAPKAAPERRTELRSGEPFAPAVAPSPTQPPLEAPAVGAAPPLANSSERAAPRTRELARSAPSALARESQLLREARAALRRADTTSASRLLQLERERPGGVLSQEREVLRIELLAAQGDAPAARRRARAFMSAHPESAHNTRLQTFVKRP